MCVCVFDLQTSTKVSIKNLDAPCLDLAAGVSWNGTSIDATAPLPCRLRCQPALPSPTAKVYRVYKSA